MIVYIVTSSTFSATSSFTTHTFSKAHMYLQTQHALIILRLINLRRVKDLSTLV